MTVAISNSNVRSCMHATSQEYLIKLLIGDFSFVIEIIVFRLNLSLNSLFCYTFTFVCKPRKSIKRISLRLRKYQRFHSENASNVFRPRYAGGISKTQQSPVILDLLERNPIRKITSLSRRLCFQKG